MQSRVIRSLKGMSSRRTWAKRTLLQGKHKEAGIRERDQVFTGNYQRIMFLGVFLTVLYLMHLILKLNVWFTLGAGVFLGCRMRTHLHQFMEQRRQGQRLSDAAVYMDTILYAFMKEGKIESALTDASHSLPPGGLKQVVEDARNHMLMTFDDSEVVQDALEIIESSYHCRRLHNIHQFMLHVETYGGEIRKPVELLIADKQKWELRTRAAMQERMKMFREIVLSIVTSLLICGVILYLPVMNVDISSNLLTQICTLGVIILDDIIFLKAQNYLMCDWLALDESGEDSYYEKKMQEWNAYDEKQARKPSLIMGTVALALGVGALVLVNQWMGAAVVLLALLFYNQHTLGHRMAGKQLVKEVKRVFPNWLMDLVLLLQSENVQVALQKSEIHVPGVLKSELGSLVTQLEMEPESAMPYHNFLEQFHIPEVQAAMSMLFSLSAGHGGNANQQVSDLIARNQEMLDIAENQKNKDLSAGMYLLFLAPVLTASFKMVVDMAVFMLTFLTVSVF